MVGRILTRALHGAGLILFYLGAAPLVRWLGRKSPKILLYHDCSPEESAYTAGLDCTTTPARFEQHLAYLSEHYAIVDIDTILAGRAPERAAAVTFDDGYASIYHHAFPALRKFDVPATVYLISSVVDNESLVWVNELNYFLHVGGEAAASCASRHFGSPATASPSEIISFCRLNYRPETMNALLSELRRMMKLSLAKHSEHARLYLTWREIFEMRESGISFGNHSRTHANLERLTEDEQSAEIEQAQRELELKLGRVSTFAHPFGHHGPTTAQLAADAGLESVAEVGGHNRPVAPLRLGRTHIGHETVASLFARMEVVEPVKEMIRRAAKRGSRQSAPQIRQEVERTSG